MADRIGASTWPDALERFTIGWRGCPTRATTALGHTVAPLELAERGGQSILKARLTGSFPGSPVTVNFSFVLADGKIRSLEIG